VSIVKFFSPNIVISDDVLHTPNILYAKFTHREVDVPTSHLGAQRSFGVSNPKVRFLNL